MRLVIRYCAPLLAGTFLGLLIFSVGAAFAAQCLDCSERF